MALCDRVDPSRFACRGCACPLAPGALAVFRYGSLCRTFQARDVSAPVCTGSGTQRISYQDRLVRIIALSPTSCWHAVTACTLRNCRSTFRSNGGLEQTLSCLRTSLRHVAEAAGQKSSMTRIPEETSELGYRNLSSV